MDGWMFLFVAIVFVLVSWVPAGIWAYSLVQGSERMGVRDWTVALDEVVWLFLGPIGPPLIAWSRWRWRAPEPERADPSTRPDEERPETPATSAMIPWPDGTGTEYRPAGNIGPSLSDICRAGLSAFAGNQAQAVISDGLIQPPTIRFTVPAQEATGINQESTDRAYSLLVECIGAQAAQQLKDGAGYAVPSKIWPSVIYVIPRDGPVKVVKEAQTITTYCVVPVESGLPWPDIAIARIKAIQENELVLFTKGNQPQR